MDKMTQITFLHTVEVHVGTFEGLMAGVDAVQRHLVHPELLARAQALGADTVRAEMQTIIARALEEGADAVLCTCSTLGPMLRDDPCIVRIDRPLMEAACTHGPRIAVALCLDSTRAGTLALLEACAKQKGTNIVPVVIDCARAWPAFEAGDTDRFATQIAEEIKVALQDQTFDCIVLAQASMRAAAPLLQETGLPVLSSPALAVARVIEVALGRCAQKGGVAT